MDLGGAIEDGLKAMVWIAVVLIVVAFVAGYLVGHL